MYYPVGRVGTLRTLDLKGNVFLVFFFFFFFFFFLEFLSSEVPALDGNHVHRASADVEPEVVRC